MKNKEIRMIVSLIYMSLNALFVILILILGILSNIALVPQTMLQYALIPTLFGVIFAGYNYQTFKPNAPDWVLIHFIGSMLVLFVALFSLLVVYSL